MKVVKVMSICIALVFFFSLAAYSMQESDGFSELVKSSGADEIYDDLDDDVKEALESIGINGVDFSALFDVSLSKVFNVVKNAALGSLESPGKSLMKLLCIIILLSVGENFTHDDGKVKPVMEVFGVLLCIGVVMVPLYQAMESAVSSVGVCGGFMKALIPVLAGVVSVAGNPMLALSFQSAAFAAAQVICLISEEYIVPIVGGVIALDITGALMPAFKLNGITDLVKKTIISSMSFVASLYVSFLGIKGVLATSADTVANKGVRLIISSVIPVVGSALSEAYSGIMGSLVLVKSTIGIFGIVVIAVITAPAIVQLLFWIFALKISAATGEVFLQDGVSRFLRALSSAATLLNVVLLLNAVLFVISLALILSLKR